MTKETLKRALIRFGISALAGAGAAFVAMPVDLTDPKRYLLALCMGCIGGAIMGLQKAVKGYLKYDR